MKNMPAGELEGLTMDEIRDSYRDGRIKAQVRWDTPESKQAALFPAKVPRTIYGGGDTIMEDTTSSVRGRRSA